MLCLRTILRNALVLLLVSSSITFAQDKPTTKTLERVKSRVRNFTPEKVKPVKFDNSRLQFDPLPTEGIEKSLQMDGLGWDGDVRFGKYLGKPVAVKFFKKGSFEALAKNNQIVVGPKAFSAKIKQGYFVLDQVHELGYAARPYAYLLENQLKPLLEPSGLRGDYYGAIVMERLFPAYHPKSFDKKAQGKLPEDPVLAQKVKDASAAVKRVGLEAQDLDFMVGKNKRFYFFDFDFWGVKTPKGVWKEGHMDETRRGIRCVRPKEILERIFE